MAFISIIDQRHIASFFLIFERGRVLTASVGDCYISTTRHVLVCTLHALF